MDNKIECKSTLKNLYKSNKLFLPFFFYLELKKKLIYFPKEQIPFFLKKITKDRTNFFLRRLSLTLKLTDMKYLN